MNILIKLMSIVSLVIAPHIAAPERGVAPVDWKPKTELDARPKVRFADITDRATETLRVVLREQL